MRNPLDSQLTNQLNVCTLKILGLYKFLSYFLIFTSTVTKYKCGTVEFFVPLLSLLFKVVSTPKFIKMFYGLGQKILLCHTCNIYHLFYSVLIYYP